MANAIFPCPFCGRRMGVNRDLLGRQVRCPHCKQVIQAPATEGGLATSPSAKMAPAPAAAPPPPQPRIETPAIPTPAPQPSVRDDRSLPAFSKPARESHDSILGDPEESEDEIFSSRSKANRMPPPDFSGFVPRLPGSGIPPQMAPRFMPTGASLTDFVPPAPLPVQGMENPFAAFSPQPMMPPAFSPAGTLPSPSDSERFAPMDEPKSATGLDATNLAAHLPRPQFQAPPPDAKGTASPTWFTPSQSSVRPPMLPSSVPGAPFPGAAMPPGFPLPGFPQPGPMGLIPPTTPYSPATPASPQAPTSSNPWSAYDLSATAAPSLPSPPAAAPPSAPPAVSQPAPATPAFPGLPSSTGPMTPAAALPVAPPFLTPAFSAAPESSAPSATAPSSASLRAEAAAAYQPRPATIRPPGKKGVSGILFGLMLVYALAATGAAVYAFFFHAPSTDVKIGADLSTIPDVIGEHPPAERKKVGKLTMPLDGPLPDNLKVGLNKTVRIGQLEVTPLGVEQKLIRVFQRIGSGGNYAPIQLGSTPTLVLRLRLKNTSNDIVFYPTDPAFNRRMNRDPKLKEPPPATGLVFGAKRFWGGPTKWPFANPGSTSDVTGEYVEGQENDSKPLAPGENRDVLIVADKADPQMMKTFKSFSGPILWRVQLRRGLENIDGKDVPLTAIVGVEFEPRDVQIKG